MRHFHIAIATAIACSALLQGSEIKAQSNNCGVDDTLFSVQANLTCETVGFAKGGAFHGFDGSVPVIRACLNVGAVSTTFGYDENGQLLSGCKAFEPVEGCCSDSDGNRIGTGFIDGVFFNCAQAGCDSSDCDDSECDDAVAKDLVVFAE